MVFVGENLGQPRNSGMQAARDFESGTTGASYVKFDGCQRLDNGIIKLIAAKMRIVLFSTKDGPFISTSARDG